MSEFKAILVPDEYYHVFNRAIGNEKLFLIEDNYRYFLQQFHKYIYPVSDLFCYSLLPNHFHFFLRTKSPGTICKQMEFLHYRQGNDVNLIPDFLLQQFSNGFNAYTKAFNKLYRRKGKLFMEPFSRKNITTPGYYTKLIHYIHANPVHHGLCRKVEEWPHSSYNEIVAHTNSWIRYDEIISWFGSMEEFIEFHQQPIERKFVNR